MGRPAQSVTLTAPFRRVLLNNQCSLDEKNGTVTLLGYQVLISEM